MPLPDYIIEVESEAINMVVSGAQGSPGVSGSDTYAGLSDAASVNLPTVNTPLASALAGRQPLDAALTALASGSDFVQFTGPTTSTKVFTLPNTNATIARTDAAQTFAGTQTFGGDVTMGGNVFTQGSGGTFSSGAVNVTLTAQSVWRTALGLGTLATQSGTFSGTSSGTNTGDITLGALGSTPDAKGATLSGQVLTLQLADATNPGLMGTGTQTFAGNKTFNGNVISGLSFSTTSGNFTTTNGDITATNGVVSGGTVRSQNIAVQSSGSAFSTIFSTSEATTANRTILLNVGNAARTITLSGNPTLGDWFDQSVKSGTAPTFAGTNFSGTAATLNIGGNAATATTAAGLSATALTTVNTITAASGTNLVLNGGSSGGQITLGQGTNANNTLTPSGTGFNLLNTPSSANFGSNMVGAVVRGSGALNGIVLDSTKSGGNGQNAFLFAKSGVITHQFGVDIGASGTKDFYIYDQTAGAARIYIGTSGGLSVGSTTNLAAGTIGAVNAVFSGTTTATGGLILPPDAQTATTAAVSIATPATKLTTTAPAQAITLANGTEGQIKIITHVATSGGGTAVLTPATKTGYTTITFAAVTDTVTLQYYTTIGWVILSIRGAVAA